MGSIVCFYREAASTKETRGYNLRYGTRGSRGRSHCFGFGLAWLAGLEANTGFKEEGGSRSLNRFCRHALRRSDPSAEKKITGIENMRVVRGCPASRMRSCLRNISAVLYRIVLSLYPEAPVAYVGGDL